MEAACTQQEVGYANVESKYTERKNKKKGTTKKIGERAWIWEATELWIALLATRIGG